MTSLWNITLDVFIIAFAWCYIIDIAQFYEQAVRQFLHLLYNKDFKEIRYIKPFSCSRCMTFWTALVYLFIVENVTIYSVAIVLLASWLTPRLTDILTLIDNLLCKLLNKIN